MNAGLPGTGIGGAFYLVCALLMPFHQLYKTLKNKGQPQRVRLILVQSGMALGIVTGIWLTGWLLGELSEMINAWLALKHGVPPPPASTLPNVLKVTLVFLTIGLLAVVVSGVHILKLIMRRRKPSRVSNVRVRAITALSSQHLPGQAPRARSRQTRVEEAEVLG